MNEAAAANQLIGAGRLPQHDASVQYCSFSVY